MAQLTKNDFECLSFLPSRCCGAFPGCLRAKMSCLGHLEEFLRLLLALSIVALFPDNLGWEQVYHDASDFFNFHGSLFLSGVSRK